MIPLLAYWLLDSPLSACSLLLRSDAGPDRSSHGFLSKLQTALLRDASPGYSQRIPVWLLFEPVLQEDVLSQVEATTAPIGGDCRDIDTRGSQPWAFTSSRSDSGSTECKQQWPCTTTNCSGGQTCSTVDVDEVDELYLGRNLRREDEAPAPIYLCSPSGGGLWRLCSRG